MARRHRHLAVALVVLAASVGAGTAYAAYSATTSAPAASFSSGDWVAPTVSATTIAKASPAGYLAGAVRTSGTYTVYVNATDSGPSGIPAATGITANVTNLTSGVTALAMPSGSCSIEGVTYGYCSATQTVGGTVTAGTKTFTITARDNVPNTATTGNQNVTVDNTVPTGSSITTTNTTGGTVGHAEQGDTLVLTFSEAIDPASIVSGWTGASMSLTARGIDGGGANDTLQLWTATTGGTQITTLGTIGLQTKNYFTGTVNYSNSTMALPSPYTTLTVTLGTPDAPASATTSGNGTMRWTPSASAFDRAGNAETTTAVNESGTNDPDF